MNTSSSIDSIFRCLFSLDTAFTFLLVDLGDVNECLLLNTKHPLTLINKQKYAGPPDEHLKIEWAHPSGLQVKL